MEEKIKIYLNALLIFPHNIGVREELALTKMGINWSDYDGRYRNFPGAKNTETCLDIFCPTPQITHKSKNYSKMFGKNLDVQENISKFSSEIVSFILR